MNSAYQPNTKICSQEVDPSLIWKLHIRLPFNHVTTIVTLLETYNLLSVSYFEDQNSPLTNTLDDNGFPLASQFIVECYAHSQIDLLIIEQAVIACLATQKIDDTLVSYSIEPVNHHDWLSECYQHLPAQRIGKFYIYGSHIAENPSDDEIGLRIDAATAFGSGDHQTTAGCLELLDHLHKNFSEFSEIVDVGCGSGILGIACKKLWPLANTTLIDCDKEAVKVACHNANLNQVTVDVLQSDGLDQYRAGTTTVGLIVANILLQPLCDLKNDFYQTLQPAGYLIVSGIIESQYNTIQEQYHDCGFTVVKTVCRDTWVSVLLKKRA